MSLSDTDTLDVLAEHAFADGTLKRLVSDDQGFAVCITRADGVLLREVFRSGFDDEAQAVFDACDGAERPWHRAYLPRGTQGTRDAKVVSVYAAGGQPLDCVRGLLDSLGTSLDEASVHPIEGDETEYQWGLAFRDTREGTAFKAAGRLVPGGAILTWWK